ncbi:unnamed protein product [Heligmosomoides polygyrus]|uniref:Amidase domain-containing protein n=1 Tax=Heligmosomoides polygyrus TaxID=6339 RepID=A0A3P8ARB0_HELPZ|nr:unnamed protein product [Heligmosomoides polygyrus]
MLQIGPICRYVEDIPLVAEVMGGENASPLRLADAADLKKTRVFYMEGIKGLSTVMSLGCEMKSALLKAVEHLEGEFDIEAIRIDLPLFSKAVEMETASLSVKGVPRHGEYLLSLKGDKGCINWVTEIPKLLTGNSVHTAGGLFFAAFDSLDRTTEEEKTKTIKLRERLSRQLNELLGDDGILLFPSWPHTAPFHNQPVFAPFNLAYTCIFNVLTLPTIQCPMGVVASHNCDRLLIAAAKEISEAFGGWTPPWEH